MSRVLYRRAILLPSENRLLSYGQKTIFNMAAVRRLELFGRKFRGSVITRSYCVDKSKWISTETLERNNLP